MAPLGRHKRTDSSNERIGANFNLLTPPPQNLAASTRTTTSATAALHHLDIAEVEGTIGVAAIGKESTGFADGDTQVKSGGGEVRAGSTGDADFGGESFGDVAVEPVARSLPSTTASPAGTPSQYRGSF